MGPATSKSAAYKIGSEIARAVSQSKNDEPLPISSDEEHKSDSGFPRPDSKGPFAQRFDRSPKGKAGPRAELGPHGLKGSPLKRPGTSQGSVLEQLEQSTSSLTENKQTFQVNKKFNLVGCGV